MTWMNSMDVELANENCASHPVLGPAAKFLKSLMDAVDRQSDGWHSWPAPSNSAGKLMDLLKHNTGYAYSPQSFTAVTLKDVERTLTPIKRMVTFQKKNQRKY